MHIQLEGRNQNTITSYDDTQLIIGESTYQNSSIISIQTILSPWAVHSLNELTLTTMAQLTQFNPEIIIIGHSEQGGIDCFQMGKK